LRETVGGLVRDAEAVLRPVGRLDLARLDRSFTLQSSEGFAENFGPSLLARVTEAAPGARLRFETRVGRDSRPLRDGSVDLQTGVVGPSLGPELRAQALFRDRFVAVVRRGHALARGKVTAARYAAGQHVRVARPAEDWGPVDEALVAAGFHRRVSVTVGGYATALMLLRNTDLIATVPERHTCVLRNGLFTFALPFAMDDVTVSLLWHPRMDADPAHRWLRDCVRSVCAERMEGTRPRSAAPRSRRRS
jgi:DNA-binding transcriptional LysR family regulator